MNHELNIPITEELLLFKDDLEYFVSTMVRKLHTNRHKGFAENETLHGLLLGMGKEVAELVKALQEEGQFEAVVEAVDIANFAFLIAMKAMQMTRQEFEEARKSAANETNA